MLALSQPVASASRVFNGLYGRGLSTAVLEPRPLTGRTLRAAMHRLDTLRSLNQAAETERRIPLSEEIVNTIVRPYQSQQSLLDRVIPEDDLKLEPVIVSTSEPVPFTAGTIDKKG
jgi:hypothetical protein